MKLVVTSARTEDVAIRAVRSACAECADLIKELMPFEFNVVRHAKTRWFVVSITKENMELEELQRFDPIRDHIKIYLRHDMAGAGTSDPKGDL